MRVVPHGVWAQCSVGWVAAAAAAAGWESTRHFSAGCEQAGPDAPSSDSASGRLCESIPCFFNFSKYFWAWLRTCVTVRVLTTLHTSDHWLPCLS
jgi:hypothetical protein